MNRFYYSFDIEYLKLTRKVDSIILIYLSEYRTKHSIFILTCVLFMCILCDAKSQATTNTEVGAVILQALTIQEKTPLHFGAMSIPSSATDVVLSTNTTRTATSPGSINLVDQAPFTTNATYTIAGSADATYAIILPEDGIVTLSNGSPGNDMSVVGFTARSSSSDKDSPTGTLSSSGLDSFAVGATLKLGDSQPSGVYIGSFNITINYN
jgi:hypothetical protein